MNDRLLALKLFVRLARTGSFSQAGKDLKLSQPSASRLIAAFEREVGAKLFVRSTRAVALTHAGADYLARIEPALAEIEEAGQALRGKGALRGSLRIGVSASAAIREVVPRLPAFLAKHPELRIDLAVPEVIDNAPGRTHAQRSHRESRVKLQGGAAKRQRPPGRPQCRRSRPAR